MKFGNAFLLCAGLSLVGPPAVAQPGPPTPTTRGAAVAVTQEQIVRAIEMLGDSDPAVRDRATRLLSDAGAAAEKALAEAVTSDDPETAGRARKLLRDFRMGIRADTPPDIVQSLKTYAEGEADQRARALLHLAGAGTEGTRALIQLYRQESSIVGREAIYSKLVEYSLGTAVRFSIASDDMVFAEQLLKDGVAKGGACEDYAAFLLISGRLDGAIRMLEAAPATKESPARDVQLAAFYRARGDMPAAVAAAKRTSDARLLRDLELEAGDLKSTAAYFADRGESIDDVCLAIGVAAAERKEKELEDAIKKGMNRAEDDPWPIAKALFFAGRHSNAIELLKKKDYWIGTISMMSMTRDFAGALKLADQMDAREPPDDPSFWAGELIILRSATIDLLDGLGERNKALAMADAVGERLKPDWKLWPDAYGELAAAERRLGRDDQCYRYFAAGLKASKAEQRRPQLFRALFRGRDVEAAFWWDHFAEDKTIANDRQRFDRVLALVNGKASIPDATAWTEAAGKSLATIARQPGAGVKFTALYNTLVRYKLFEAADETLQALGEASPSAFVARERSRLAGLQNRWAAAADLLGTAARSTSDDAVLVYQYSVALRKAGRADDADQMSKRASLLALGDDQIQGALVKAMREADDPAAARKQVDLMFRTGRPGLSGSGLAARLKSVDLTEAGEHAEAARLLVLGTLPQFRGEAYPDSDRDMISHAGNVLMLTAIADQKSGRLEVPVAEAAISLYASEDLLSTLVDRLDKARQREQADRLFRNAWDRHQDVLKEFPRHALSLNNAAWLAACCNRELPAAAKMADLAVAKDEQSTSCLDTQAEVYFKLGRAKDAAAIIRRCLEIKPEDPYLKKQLARFEGK